MIGPNNCTERFDLSNEDLDLVLVNTSQARVCVRCLLNQEVGAYLVDDMILTSGETRGVFTFASQELVIRDPAVAIMDGDIPTNISCAGVDDFGYSARILIYSDGE